MTDKIKIEDIEFGDDVDWDDFQGYLRPFAEKTLAYVADSRKGLYCSKCGVRVGHNETPFDLRRLTLCSAHAHELNRHWRCKDCGTSNIFSAIGSRCIVCHVKAKEIREAEEKLKQEERTNMIEIQKIAHYEVLERDVKIYGTSEKPLFLADDISNWFGLVNVLNALTRVDDSEKVFGKLDGVTKKFVTSEGFRQLMHWLPSPVNFNEPGCVQDFVKGVSRFLYNLETAGIGAQENKPMTNETDTGTGMSILEATAEGRKARRPHWQRGRHIWRDVHGAWSQMITDDVLCLSAMDADDVSATDWKHYVEEIVPEEDAPIAYCPAVPNLVHEIGTRVTWLDESKKYWLSGKIHGGLHLNITELYAVKVDTTCIEHSERDEAGTTKRLRVDEVIPTITPVVILPLGKFQVSSEKEQKNDRQG